jgi:hypothetical protein
MVEINRDEKQILQPMMIRVAPKEAHSGRGSGSRPAWTQWINRSVRINAPIVMRIAPRMRPPSSLKWP